MKHYKFHNSRTGSNFVVTETGRQNIQRDKQLGPVCSFIGECDEQGNLFAAKKEEPKVKETIEPVNPNPTFEKIEAPADSTQNLGPKKVVREPKKKS